MNYINQYIEETKQIMEKIDKNSIKKIVDLIDKVREEKGRIFFIGSGGGSGNATHAVNDFRKIAGIESYTPTDNVSELTARTNDEGWDSVFVEYLKTSKLNKNDMVFVLSVGGGNEEKNISVNIIKALKYAKNKGAKICGIVGRDGGYTKKVSDAVVLIPTINKKTITPHTEAYQGVICHLIVSHPKILKNEMKWESTK